jgi:CDP-diacylglycerol--glycerol-3-phosphate 3-phosphatidyltransferase
MTQMGLSPNAVTLLGLLGAGASAILLGSGLLAAGGAVLLLTSVFDLFDGALARATGRASKFGALLDSTVDRASEAVVLLGLLVHFLGEASEPGAILVYIALAGSVLVSYVRARAGSLGIDCRVGVFTRPERVVALGTGLVIGQWWAPAVLVVLTAIGALTTVTTVQRVLHVRRELAADMDR